MFVLAVRIAIAWMALSMLCWAIWALLIRA
jgi:hypothetical protein